MATGETLMEREAEEQGRTSWPFVSVIVPCRNEQRHIAQCLDSILANDYPSDQMEILVLDGMSEDRTREIVRGYEEKYSRVRLVDNLKRTIPAALNTGISNARGDVVIKMDAHSTYQSSHIRLCVAYQEKYRAENVGGVWNMLPGSDSGVARAIVVALAHRFGSGGAKIKVGVTQPTWTDSAAFGCFKKELFSRIGLFNERLRASSDTDMNMRIKAAGGRILLVPEIVVNYFADPNLKAFWKHNFADGVWVTYVMKFGSRGWCWRHWVPMEFVLSLLVSIVLAFIKPAMLPLFLGIVGLYLVVNLGVSLQLAIRERSVKDFFLLPIVFAVRHLAHGSGALLGLMLAPIPGEIWKGRRGRKA